MDLAQNNLVWSIAFIQVFRYPTLQKGVCVIPGRRQVVLSPVETATVVHPVELDDSSLVEICAILFGTCCMHELRM